MLARLAILEGQQQHGDSAKTADYQFVIAASTPTEGLGSAVDHSAPPHERR